jgi:hypothetical protein
MWFSKRFLSDLGKDQNKFTYNQTSNEDGTLATYNLNFEQHANMSKIEEIGLNVLGFDIVNVAQNLKINFSET